MKTLMVPIRTDRLVTKEDIQYAIVNREEQLEGIRYHVPELRKKAVNVKLKEGAGLWCFITGCLP
jgi:hypothetical protein